MKKGTLWLFGLLVIGSAAAAQDYSWAMERGFGFDANADGRLDIPNTPEYAATTAFDVSFSLTDGYLQAKGFPKKLLAQGGRVELTDAKGGRFAGEGPLGNLKVPRLPVGRYQGSLVFVYANEVHRLPVTIEPKRYLIAVIGDSYSSGEGAPEVKYEPGRRSVWADDGQNGWEKVNHMKAHRSSKAWGPQMALFLEEADPHSSVIFLFLPISGGRINSGVLTPALPKDYYMDYELMPSEIDDLKRLVGSQRIDYLMMTIGGNDLGFVPVVTMTLLVNGERRPKKMERILDGVREGQWEGGFARFMGYNNEPQRIGLNKLPLWLEKMDTALKANFSIGQIVLLEYILPLTSGQSALGDIVPGFGVDATEATLFTEQIVGELRKVQQAACSRFGWTFAPVFSSIDYGAHSYNADKDYEAPAYNEHRFQKPTSWNDFYQTYVVERKTVSFFRTCTDSRVIQGAFVDGKTPNAFTTGGTFHPNEIGYQAMMHQALRALRLPPDFPAEFRSQYLP